MAAYNDILAMNGHTSPASSGEEMSATQSFYNETKYSDERLPLLIYTPTRKYEKKSSILYVNKGAFPRIDPEKQKGSRYS